MVGAEDRVTVSGWKALAGSVLGFAMEGFHVLILGFMLAAISADLGLTSTQAGALVSWTLLGAVAGGFLFGTLSDHLGRIRVLTWTIVIFAAFTGLCAVARGYWDLVAYRILAGLGLGGEYGIGMALAAEAWPASKRARVSSYVALGWQAGVLLAALVTPLLLPTIGWRGMFAVGVLPALVAFIVRRTLDEPEIFVKRHAAEQENSFRWLVKDGRTVKTSVGIVVLASIQNFGYYGMLTWMPTYLATSFGFNLTKSAMWTSITILGMVIGNSGRRDYGLPIFAHKRTESAALDGPHHGNVCERDARWLWSALLRGVSHGRPCNRAERLMEHRPRSRWPGTRDNRLVSCTVFFQRSVWPACNDLPLRHPRDSVLDSRAQREAARVGCRARLLAELTIWALGSAW
jgi:MFS family permease